MDPDGDTYLNVNSLRLSDFIKSQNHKLIVLKLDVEGAEYAILDDLLKTNVIDMVEKLYVEFHSELYTKSKRSFFITKENELISSLQNRKVNFTIWH